MQSFAYNPPVAQPSSQELEAGTMVLQTARTTCRELVALLMEENTHVGKHKVAFVEEKLQVKKQLTTRMEQLLIDIKKYVPILKVSVRGKNELMQLAKEVQLLQEISAKNMAVLQAAHKIRADIVMTIRDVMDSAQPKAQLYGANGRLQQTDGNTRLVAQNV
jgi:hypothetical protein